MSAGSLPMISWRTVCPARGERALYVGKTGSGKSYLARLVTRCYSRYIVLDAKGDWRPQADDILVRTLQGLRSPPGPRLVWRPPSPSPEEADRVCWWSWYQGDILVVIDDINLIIEGSQLSDGLRACITTGRARGVTMVICSQRPYGVPVVVRSESDVYAVFRLQNPNDRRYMAEVIGEEVLTPTTGHSFWLYRSSVMDRPVLCEVRGG